MTPKRKKPKLLITETELIVIMRMEKERIKLMEFGKKEEFKVFWRIAVDDEETHFVTCMKCNDSKLIKYDPKLGASSINHHLSRPFHTKGPSDTKVQTKVEQFMVKPVPMIERQRVYEKIALWCAMDNRPFNIVEGKGFKDVVSSITQVASKLGKVDANDLVPCKATVRKYTSLLYDNLTMKMTERMGQIDYINATTDHWKDIMSGASYMTICIHYVNVNGLKLENRIISTFEVGDKCAKTTANHFNQKLMQFKLESKLRIVITDSASSMIKAFECVKWLPCAAHNMCLLQKYAFNQHDNHDTDPFLSISKLIAAAKSMVAKVKRGNFYSDLICKLKQEVETRWDSNYDLLESVSKNYHILVMESSLRTLMDDIPAGLLQEVLEILKPLKDMRIALCSDSNITLNMVVLTHLKVCELMVNSAKDSVPIHILKNRFRNYLKTKFVLYEHHIIATFLTPAYRSVPKNHCDSKLVNDSMKLLKSYLEDVPESDDEDDVNQSENIHDQSSSNGLFSSFKETPVQAPIESSNELSDYEGYKLTKYDIDCSPFEFWSLKRSTFPKLCNIAKWILSCPATSTSSERVFSKLGNIITPSRNLLDPDMVDQISFVSSNSDMI